MSLTEEQLLTKTGKPRKRKPKTKNNYFTKDTEDAILKYRKCQDLTERNKIYNEEIHYGFYKLVENIIHTFKFYYTEVDNIEDLKYEVISFLLQKLDLYNPTKGKAYSYFGTIAKRYLIIYNQKNYKKFLQKAEISNELEEEDGRQSAFVEENEPELDKLDVVEMFIKYVDDNLLDLFTKEDELKAADAVLEIFKKRENIDIFNKRAVFIYVKEMTDAESNTITKVIKRLKTIYKEILNDYLENRDY
jgi:hypothetical protein